MVLPHRAARQHGVRRANCNGRERSSCAMSRIFRAMPLSVTAPIDVALRRTGAILFRDFDATKWLKLGVCAFLAQLGDCAGGNGASGVGSRIEDRQGRPDFGQARDWISDNLIAIGVIGTLVVLFVVAVMLLVLWLQSRGRFMLLDGVVHDRGAVARPWHEFRAEADSLFGFTLLLALASGAIAFLAVGLGVALGWSDLNAERFGGGALLALVLGGGLLVVNAAAFGLIHLLTHDFVVPCMYARRCGALAAWRAVRQEILRRLPVTVVLYVLMRVALWILGTIATFMLMCGTVGAACCLLMIPFVATLVLLPLTVFNRCYSLAFLEQLGPTWTLGPTPEPEHTH